MASSSDIFDLARRQGGRVQGLVGLVLIAIWWPIAWGHLRPVSDYYFFPLWLGYVLTIDGLVHHRTGTSPLVRSPRKFMLLFAISAPFWWLFEWMNLYLDNWQYLSPQPYGSLEYALLASISFSTVVPAVLETAELLASLHVVNRLPPLPAFRPGPRGLIALHLLGWTMLAFVLLIPRYAFPLAWLSIFFIVEPVNVKLGQRSIGKFVQQGNWRPVWLVMLAALTTGFFWEMWNNYSMPKWTYTVPFVEFVHLFEMPILGYLGYLPFGLEVFAVYALVSWFIDRHPEHYMGASLAARIDRSRTSPYNSRGSRVHA